MNYSPWPDEGKRWRFEWRRATWMLARPWYGANNVRYELKDLTWLSPLTFWFPFISFRSARFHCYLGWKPINPIADPAFYWRELGVVDARLYVQLSARWGFGGIS